MGLAHKPTSNHYCMFATLLLELFSGPLNKAFHRLEGLGFPFELPSARSRARAFR